MLKKIENLASKLATQGLDRAEVNRLIAKVEEDGVATPKELASLKQLLANDGFVNRPARKGRDNFAGHGRAELASYIKFVERVNDLDARGVRGEAAIRGAAIGDRPEIDVKRYRETVEILAGARPTTLVDDAGNKRQVYFRDRFLGSPKNQLDQMVQWLTQQYQAMGLEAQLEPVKWHNRTYYNVVVTFPGESKQAIALCDHYDVAAKETILKNHIADLKDHYGLTDAEIKKRLDSIKKGEAVPGADDNASASSALLETAAFLKQQLDQGVKLGHPVKIVHLVGEEFPASCLGGRVFLKNALERKEQLAGVVVLDMIGVDRTKQRKVQLSVGRNDASLEMAALVKAAVRGSDLDLKPVLRPFNSRKSYLYNTDGIEFSRAGLPVILLNEHVNKDRDLYRIGYHDEFDVPQLMDFGFATEVTRAALHTVYRMAEPTR